MPPIFHFRRAIGRAASRILVPRHGAAHYVRKLGPQAALVVGGLGGGIAIDHGVRELMRPKEPLHQEGAENASLDLVDRSWNLVQFKSVDESLEEERDQPSPHHTDSALHHFLRFRMVFMVALAILVMYILLRITTAIRTCVRSRRSASIDLTPPPRAPARPARLSPTPPPGYSELQYSSPELDTKTAMVWRSIQPQDWTSRANPGPDFSTAATRPFECRTNPPRQSRASILESVPGRIALVSPTPQAQSKAPTAPGPALPQDTELRVTSSVTDTASAASSSTESLPSMERISESGAVLTPCGEERAAPSPLPAPHPRF